MSDIITTFFVHIDKVILNHVNAAITSLKARSEAAERIAQEVTKRAEKLAEETKKLNKTISELTADNEEQAREIDRLNEVIDEVQVQARTMLFEEAMFNVNRTVIVALEAMACMEPEELKPLDVMGFDNTTASNGKNFLNEIGAGGFGFVLIGRLKGREHPVAIKRPIKPEGMPQEELERIRKRNTLLFEEEAMAGQLLSKSPLFPEMIGMVVISGDHCIVTNFIRDTSSGKVYRLFDAINNSDPEMPKWNLVAICGDVIRGIDEMHRLNFLHNDVKDDNVLLEYRRGRWRGVIIDLGLISTMVQPHFGAYSESQKERRKQGDIAFAYMAPEVMEGGLASVASDVFSVGTVLKHVAEFISEGGLLDLAQVCIKEDPDDRPRHVIDILPDVRGIREKLMARNGDDKTEMKDEDGEAEVGKEDEVEEDEEDEEDEVVEEEEEQAREEEEAQDGGMVVEEGGEQDEEERLGGEDEEVNGEGEAQGKAGTILQGVKGKRGEG